MEHGQESFNIRHMLRTTGARKPGPRTSATYTKRAHRKYLTMNEAIRNLASSPLRPGPVIQHDHLGMVDWGISLQTDIERFRRKADRLQCSPELRLLFSQQWRVIERAKKVGLQQSVDAFQIGSSGIYTTGDAINSLKRAYTDEHGVALQSERDIIYVAVSYSHRKYQSEEEFLEAIHGYVNDALPRGVQICLWIDRIYSRRSKLAQVAVGTHIPWTLVGLFPYSLCYVAPLTDNKTQLNRLWISAEHVLGAYGLGVLLSRERFREQVELYFHGKMPLWGRDCKLVSGFNGPDVSLRLFSARFLDLGFAMKEATFEEDRDQIYVWATYIATLCGCEPIECDKLFKRKDFKHHALTAMEAAAMYKNLSGAGQLFECTSADRVLKLLVMNRSWDGYREWVPGDHDVVGTEVTDEAFKRFNTYWHVITVQNGARLAIGERLGYLLETNNAMMVFLDSSRDDEPGHGRVLSYVMNFGLAFSTLKILRWISDVKHRQPPSGLDTIRFENYGYYYEHTAMSRSLSPELIEMLVEAIKSDWNGILQDLDITKIELIHDDQVLWNGPS